VDEFRRRRGRPAREQLEGEQGPRAVGIATLEVQTGGARRHTGHDERTHDDGGTADHDGQMNAIRAQVRRRAARIEHVAGDDDDEIGPGCLGRRSIVVARVRLFDDGDPMTGCLERHPHDDDDRIDRSAARSLEHDAAHAAPAFEVGAGQRIAQACEKSADLSRVHALQLRPHVHTRLRQSAGELEQQALLPG
jgi:hypothetical protein